MAIARVTIEGRQSSRATTFADRLMGVFEVIAVRGPISLGDLASATNLPKPSAWRLSKALKDGGWVRVRLQDSRYEVSPRIDKLLTAAYLPAPEVDEVAGIVASIQASRDFAVSVGVLQGAGSFIYLDATHQGHLQSVGTSLVNDLAPTAALLGCSRLQVLRHLEVYARSCSREESSLITNGIRQRELYTIASRWSGVVLGADDQSFAIPWYFKTGLIGSVEISRRHAARECGGETFFLSQRLSELGSSNRRLGAGLAASALGQYAMIARARKS